MRYAAKKWNDINKFINYVTIRNLPTKSYEDVPSSRMGKETCSGNVALRRMPPRNFIMLMQIINIVSLKLQVCTGLRLIDDNFTSV